MPDRYAKESLLSGQLAASGRLYGPSPGQLNFAYNTADQMLLAQVRASRDCTLDRLGFCAHNTPGAATRTIWVPVYDDVNGRPGVRLGYASFPANYASWSYTEAVVSIAITAGRKWIGYVQNGTGTVATMAAVAVNDIEPPVPRGDIPGGRVLRYDGVTGTPPADLTATPPTWQDIYTPCVYWRRAA